MKNNNKLKTMLVTFYKRHAACRRRNTGGTPHIAIRYG